MWWLTCFKTSQTQIAWRLSSDALVSADSTIIGQLGLCKFVLLNEPIPILPKQFHGLAAPLSTLTGGADGFAV
jgi:hypothetical protein